MPEKLSLRRVPSFGCWARDRALPHRPGHPSECQCLFGPRTGRVRAWTQLVLCECLDDVIQYTSALDTRTCSHNCLLRGGDCQECIRGGCRYLQTCYVQVGSGTISYSLCALNPCS